MTFIGRYRVYDLLGSGGMGVVYRAKDETLRRSVALKFLAPTLAADEEYRARFLREARVAASLNHPNTCVVYEVGVLDQPVSLPHDDQVLGAGTPFIAMEFVEGETLAVRLERSGPLSVRMAIDIALQLAEGLAEAHALQIVHRDLKPQNVMITLSGRVKIVDFGLAKPIRPVQDSPALVSTSEMISADIGDGAVIGTCAYMSPEQATGKDLDARSDVFSFGTMLYQMLTGRLPFEGDTPTETIAKILEANPAPWPPAATSAAKAFGRIVKRCLNKKTVDRYPDARALLKDLEEIELAASRDVQQPPSPWHRRSLALFAVIVLALVAMYSRSPGIDDGGANPSPSPSSPPIGGESPDAPRPEPGPVPPPGPAPKPRPATTPGPVPVPPEGVNAIEPESTPPRSGVGTIAVTSVPRSSVSLDDNLMGVTPLTLEADVGTHEVVLTGPNGLRWRGRVVVTEGEVSSLHRDLNATGRLSVVSDVWYEVSLDDGPPEQTPIHFDRVATGLHTLRASRDGYVTQDIEIVIEEGTTSSQRITLKKER